MKRRLNTPAEVLARRAAASAEAAERLRARLGRAEAKARSDAARAAAALERRAARDALRHMRGQERVAHPSSALRAPSPSRGEGLTAAAMLEARR